MEKLNGTHINGKERPEIIYVYDALCGWCYGFSPVITRIKSEYADSADFLVLSGGMIQAGQAGPISMISDFIKSAYKTVENTCGVKFGDKFINETLEKGEAIFRQNHPPGHWPYSGLNILTDLLNLQTRLQKAIYVDGISTDDLNAYGSLAREFDMDPENFVNQMYSDPISEIIRNEFSMVKSMGITGYPSVALRKGKEIQIVSRGYKDHSTLKSLLNQHLNGK